jgi:hypothetical protein
MKCLLRELRNTLYVEFPVIKMLRGLLVTQLTQSPQYLYL